MCWQKVGKEKAVWVNHTVACLLARLPASAGTSAAEATAAEATTSAASASATTPAAGVVASASTAGVAASAPTSAVDGDDDEQDDEDDHEDEEDGRIHLQLRVTATLDLGDRGRVVDLALDHGDDRVDPGFDPLRRVACLELGFDAAGDDHLGRGIRQDAFDSVAGRDPELALLHGDQEDDAVVGTLLSHTPLVTDVGGVAAGRLATQVLHRDHGELGAVGVLEGLDLGFQPRFVGVGDDVREVVDELAVLGLGVGHGRGGHEEGEQCQQDGVDRVLGHAQTPRIGALGSSSTSSSRGGKNSASLLPMLPTISQIPAVA